MSRRERRLPLLACALAALCACREDMHDQPRLEPFERSPFFADGRGSRRPPEGTVARGSLPPSRAHLTGRDAEGALLEALPVELTADLLARGRERFDIHCAPCHGRTGRGDGMVVRRGYPRPTSFGDPAVRAKPAGHVFDVITHGYARMPSYAGALTPTDRWAVTAYVQALQLAHGVPVERLSEADRRALAATGEDP